MFIACGLCGALSGFLLGGWGFDSWVPLRWTPVLFIAFMTMFPAGTVGLMRAPWWLPPAIFSAPLLFLIAVAVGQNGQWVRALVAAVFIIIAFAGARARRPRVVT